MPLVEMRTCIFLSIHNPNQTQKQDAIRVTHARAASPNLDDNDENPDRQQQQHNTEGGPEILLAGYSRRALGQTGDGHFSPIGGYHRGKDLVLLMDVARFKCKCVR